jgi:hypothetical protein
MLVNQVDALLVIELPLVVELVHLRLNIIERHALVLALLAPIALIHLLIQNGIQKLSPLEILLVFILRSLVSETMESY